MIEKLTDNQENQISIYRKKWQKIASTPISLNHIIIKDFIQFIYSAQNLPPPTIFYYPSPRKAIESILLNKFGNSLSKSFYIYYNELLFRLVCDQISPKAISELDRRILSLLMHTSSFPINFANKELLYPLIKPFIRSQRRKLNNCIQPENWVPRAGFLDFCISVLHCTYSPNQWKVFQLLVQYCGWLYPYRQACIVCERPNEIELKPGFSSISYNDGQTFQYSYEISNDKIYNSWLLDLLRIRHKYF